MKYLLRESSFQVECLTEQTDNGKKLYIEGIFAQAEVKNGNGRFYPKGVLEQAVHTYNEDFVNKRRALGELSHPDRPFALPEEAAIIIESLSWHGNNVVGKAQVMNTPKGLTLKGLLEANFSLGVSTRGLGSLTETRQGKVVNKDFMMTAIDAVDNPSGPDCYVKPLLESMWDIQNGIWVPRNELNEQLILQSIEDFVNTLKKSR
jgi:hypothetical protein